MRRKLRALQAVAFVSIVDRYAIAPLLVVIARDLGVSVGAVAAVASVHFLSYGLFQPLWGFLTDRFGLVRTVRFSLFGAGVFALASALAPTLVTFGVARALSGAFMAASLPAALVYIGDVWPALIRQRAIADIAAATAVGTATATLGAGVISELVHWRLVFGLAALSAVLVGIVLNRLPEPERQRGPHAGPLRTIANVLKAPWVPLIFVFAFVEGMVVLGILPYLPTALQYSGASASIAGLAVSSYGLGVLLWSRVAKAAVGRFTGTVFAGVGGAMLVVGWTLSGVRLNVLVVVVCGLLLGGAWAFLHTTLQSWATGVSAKLRATTVSLFATSLFLGSSAGAAVGAPLADEAQFDVLFLGASAVSVPLTVAVMLALRSYSRDR